MSAIKRDLFVAILITLFAAGQVASTYGSLSQTWDEPFHIAAGMEWLQHSLYEVEPLHPPLARVAVALGPFLAGLRLSDGRLTWQKAWQEGSRILHTGGSYFQNLTLARLGVLPFLFVGTGIVWLWTRRLFGTRPALFSILLFTTLPAILAHSGLATTDMAAAALIGVALFSFVFWAERPSIGRSVLLGVTTAFAILSKFSSVIFLPASLLAIGLTRLTIQGRNLSFSTSRSLRCWITASCVTAAIACLVIWAGYRFSLVALTTAEARPHELVDQFVGARGFIHDLTYKLLESQIVPLHELALGVRSLIEKNRTGQGSFFLGEPRNSGVWYYFPIVLAVKTPIPFQIFFMAGSVVLIRHVKASRDWRPLVPLVAGVAILAVCLSSNINVGVRHILPIYPLMAVVGGLGAASIWNSSGLRIAVPIVLGLFLWQGITAFHTRPDFLAYFNAFAGTRPERILVDSDLDWGQDLQRLVYALKSRGIEEVSIAYFGTADLRRHELPRIRLLVPEHCATGWIAISTTTLMTGAYADGTRPGYILSGGTGFQWLANHEPVTLIGRSIRLYYISDSDCAERPKIHGSYGLSDA